MGKNSLLKAAGILMIVAGVFNLIYGTLAFTNLIDIKAAVRYLWIISPLPYFGFATAFTGHPVISNVLMTAYLVGIPLAIIGGSIFLAKRNPGSWLLGTLGAVLCFPLLGIASIVLALFPAPKPTG